MAEQQYASLTLPTAPKLKEKLYDQSYFDQIMSNMQDQANQALTSPEAKQKAAKSREAMAGAGVLSGGAYDVSQADWARQLQSDYAKQGLQDVATAKAQEAEYEANLPTQQLTATSQYQSQLGNLANIYKDLASQSPEAASYYNQILSTMTGVPSTAGTNIYDYGKQESETKKAEKEAVAQNLESNIEKKLDPAVYTASQFKDFAQSAVDNGYITADDVNRIISAYDLGGSASWEMKDSARTALISAIRKGKA